MDDLSEILFKTGEPADLESIPVVPPVYQSSNFYYKKVDVLRQAFRDEYASHTYTRGNNPTVEVLRKKIAALSGAEDSLVVSSGAAAMSLAVLANVKAGAHIICVKHPYGWTEKLCRIILAKFKVETTFVETTEVEEAIFNAVRPNTSVIILESPNTFTFEVQNLRKISAYAKTKGITTIIDNTYSTPIGQRCIEMGIDLEVHSVSKYINGHSDVVAGAIIGNRQRIEAIYHSEFLNIGSIISPHDAWLILRGLRTLPIRLKQIGETAQTIINALKQMPWVEQVIHPFQPDFPNHELAKKQMNWHGGLFSILVKTTDINAIEVFCEQLQFFRMAVSWGGHESLIMPACAFYEMDYSGKRKYPLNLLRIYVGLEDANTLINDLKQSAKHFV